VPTNPTEQVPERTADPYSAQQIIVQMMAPNVDTEHSQTQDSTVQYVLKASAAADETSVLATNVETASTVNNTARVDMLTTAGNGALQNISAPQTSNMEGRDQKLHGGWGGIQQPRSAFRPVAQAILPHEMPILVGGQLLNTKGRIHKWLQGQRG
jgi:hypothetical protein